MSSFKVLKYLDKDKWLDLLLSFPTSFQDIYFSPEYYNLYERNDEGEAQCFIFEKDGSVALYPFLLNNVNKLGYELDHEYFDIQGAYGYNGVLSTCYDGQFIDDFHRVFSAFCQDNNIIAEFTRFHPLLNNQMFSEEHFDVYLDRETVWLDLSQEYDTIWEKEFSGRNRNMIRKAEKMGVTSFLSTDQDDFEQFIELYHETMKHVGATDYFYFNNDYFYNIKEGLKSHHHLIVSKVEEEFAGGMILFIYGDYAHYHLSARKFGFGKYAINNHFLNYAIKIAKEQGCKKMHFGGGLTADLKDPLLKFKSDFSKQRANFYFGKKVHNKKVYKQVTEQWKNKYPDSFKQNKIKLLGYREI